MTSVGASPTTKTTPLADVGNLVLARGARGSEESRSDLYRCVHSYFRWRAETLESSPSYLSDCRRDDGIRRRRRRDAAAVALASLSKGAETGAATGVPGVGGAAEAGRPAEDATSAHRGAGGGKVGDADVEVEMCLRIVSALEEALPQLSGDCNSRSPEGADAGSQDDVPRGSDEENDGGGTRRLLHSAGVKDAVAGNLSNIMVDETRGGDTRRGTGKADSASPAMSECKEPPSAEPLEDDKRSGTTNDRGKCGGKEGDPRRPDDRSDPSRSEGPDPPSPELETRYDAYPDHLRQIYELQARVLHLQREEIDKLRAGMLHLQRNVDNECRPSPQTQWHNQHPPFWHPSWPASPPWQQQPSYVQFHRDHPNERAASASRGGKRRRVERPRQHPFFPTATEEGTAPVTMVPPVVAPVRGRGEAAVATTTTRTKQGFGAGPVNIGVDGSICGGGLSRGDSKKTTAGAEVVPDSFSSRKRGDVAEENSGSGNDEFDYDDQSDSLLSKMSGSEYGSVAEEDGDTVDSSSGRGIASDCESVDSSENESEAEDDCDGPGEALDNDEVSTVSATAPEMQETTNRHRATTRPAPTKSPSPQTGKKKGHMDQESETAVGQANTTTTATQNSNEDAAAVIGTSSAAAVGSVFNEGAPGICSARKPRSTPAAVALWEKRFLELVEYHGVHGHCRVPGTYKANRALARWVSRQRTLYASNRLSCEKVNRLNGLGFTWRDAWELSFAQLVAFRERTGHTRVPYRNQGYHQLGSWVEKQRSLYTTGHLSDEKIQRLNGLGFEWQREVDGECSRPSQSQWQQHHPQQSPIWHPSWPAPPRWPQQQQLPYMQFYTNYPNQQATSVGGDRKRVRVDHPQQDTVYPVAAERGTVSVIRRPPIAPPGRGREKAAVAATTTRTRRGFGAGPSVYVGVGKGGGGSISGDLVSRGDEEKTAADTEVVSEASLSRKRGAAIKKKSESGSDGFDDDDQNDGFLSKMSDSEDSGASHEHDGTVESNSGSGNASNCDSSENESEGDRDGDGHGHGRYDVSDEEDVSAAPATSLENRKVTVRRTETPRPPRPYSPTCRVGKKKRKLDQELETMVAAEKWASTAKTPAENAGENAAAAVGSVSNEGESVISSARKPRHTLSAYVALWEKRFLELVEYHGVHGHCRVPSRYKANLTLASWVKRQRKMYASNRLSSEKVKRLNGLGFTWSVLNKNAWEHRHEELVAFKERVGHTRVTKSNKAHAQLGHWVAKQRYFYAIGQLSDEKIERLNEVGFEWKIMGHQLETGAAAEKWASTATTPAGNAGEHAASVESVSKESAPCIPSAGKPRNAPSAVVALWEKRFLELVEYHRVHGNCRVPGTYKANRSLASWVKRQRTMYASNTLSCEKMNRLNELGFTWSIVDKNAWEHRFLELLAFKERMGHTRVPKINKVHPQLGHWVAKQRELYASGHLSDEKIERLNDLGFEWKIRKDPRLDWEGRYQQLVRFREKHGHCDVTPAEAIKMAVEDAKIGRGAEREDAEEGKSGVVNDLLYVWTSRLRKEYRNFREGKKSWLDDRKIEKLDGIGFDWMLGHTKSRGQEQNTAKRSGHTKVPWPRRLRQLCNFQLTQGHMNIPRVYEEDDNLGGWARKMRQMYWKHMRGNLASEELQSRFEKLTDLGFSWKLPAATPAPPKSWNERYQQLLEFRAEKGHTRVPTYYAADPTLASWVVKQRRLFNLRQQGKNCSLNDDQIRILNEIGFEWSVCVSAKKKYIGQLRVNAT